MCHLSLVIYCSSLLIGQVHYDSFDVSLLGFDEEDGEEPDMEAEKDDDEGIEG